MGQLAVRDPVTLADRDPARGVAGRGRLRHGSPPPDRARGGAGRAERLLPGPAVPRYPTVEVRVADVCLDAGTAVLLAGLTRALVATALAEARRGTPVAAPPARQVAAALVAAARQGLAGAGADPVTGQAAGAAALGARLLDHVYPALSDHGDTETITGLLRRLDDRGTGADRQRALFTSAASTPAYITALARATLSGHEPGRWRRPMPGSRQRQARSRVGGRAVQDPPPSPGALPAGAVALCQ